MPQPWRGVVAQPKPETVGQRGTQRFRSSHGPTRQNVPGGQSRVLVQACGVGSQMLVFATQWLPFPTAGPTQMHPSGQSSGPVRSQFVAQLPFARQFCPPGHEQLISRPQSFAATPLQRRSSAQTRSRGRDLQRCLRLWARARRLHARRLTGSRTVRQRGRALCASTPGVKLNRAAIAPGPPVRAVRRDVTARVKASNVASSMGPPWRVLPCETLALSPDPQRRKPCRGCDPIPRLGAELRRCLAWLGPEAPVAGPVA